ncbi:MAG TPA: zincin-like metallopeptidase domain-containing protein [Chitinophagales bacterium]|nr:zincin-like metallopeptidase domain-containing protein [Chitinophagales bacterium]
MNNTATPAANAAKHDVYEIVTEQIIAQLEKGTVPWQQPWTKAGLPQNLISKRAYRGINVWLLASLGYSENYFLTYKQLKEFGGSVRKDEKAHIVVYWNYIEKNDDEKANGNGKSNGKARTPFLRYYKVFNVAQCNDIPEMFIKPVTRQAYPIPACEEIVERMPQKPLIRHKENRAYYHPLSDFVNMPKKETFKSDESYYATLFHELVHSTGHHTRLNRSTLIQMSEFGFERYSHEELVAEIGACYLECLAGIITTEFDRNASYIQGWLERLRNDKKFILSASSHAQKATDFILNVKFEEKESAEEKDEK